MIIHLDMDAFFAAVEQLDNPKLRGKPVIVGGDRRGVVSTASYEARVFGIHSAMPISTARKLCPQGIFLQGHGARYSQISRSVIQCLHDFSPLVEQASIDEAYLDATGLDRLFPSFEELGKAIKEHVFEVTGGLTCSLGIAPVKFLAKICSDINKPDGLYILTLEEMDNFLIGLPIEKLSGVGRNMGEKLRRLGIFKVGDLRHLSHEYLLTRFGKIGHILYERAQGQDRRGVNPHHEVKSEGSERTFLENTTDREFLMRVLYAHAERVAASLRAKKLRGRTITIKIKFADFRTISRSLSLSEPSNATETIFVAASSLLAAESLPKSVRLLGLSVSGFGGRISQLPLDLHSASSLPKPQRQNNLPQKSFSPHISQGDEIRRERLDRAIDQLRNRFGAKILQRGRLYVQDSSEN